MNSAVIAKIEVYPHPNADRIQLGNVLGYQVVVGLDVKSGDLGIFFPEGLQLSRGYCKANKLLREDGGYFEDKRRVKCQKFRGERSEGFWSPLSSLDYLGSHKLSEGDRITGLNGKDLCQKYITPATRMKRSGKVRRGETRMFKKHVDTDQLRMNMHRLNQSKYPVVITQKLHGTSQRVGRVKDEVKPSKFQKFLETVLGKYAPERKKQWRYLIGSRNVILEPDTVDYYGSGFREQSAAVFLGRLEKGETVYYEVVGYEKMDSPIMGSVKNKEFPELNKNITYKYGCPNGSSLIYVYRITHTNEDGYTFDLPWEAVKERCKQLNVRHVPEIAVFHYGNAKQIKGYIDEYFDENEKADPLDPTHPLEGVCVRIDNPFKIEIYKHKTFTFGVLEGYLKSQDTYVDTEESS